MHGQLSHLPTKFAQPKGPDPAARHRQVLLTPPAPPAIKSQGMPGQLTYGTKQGSRRVHTGGTHPRMTQYR